MLLAIRSEMDRPTPEFQKRDRLISANIVNYRYIEYLIDRPVISYVLTDGKGTGLIKEKKGYKLTTIGTLVTYFSTHKQASDYLEKNPELKQNLFIKEVIE